MIVLKWGVVEGTELNKTELLLLAAYASVKKCEAVALFPCKTPVLDWEASWKILPCNCPMISKNFLRNSFPEGKKGARRKLSVYTARILVFIISSDPIYDFSEKRRASGTAVGHLGKISSHDGKTKQIFQMFLCVTVPVTNDYVYAKRHICQRNTGGTRTLHSQMTENRVPISKVKW